MAEIQSPEGIGGGQDGGSARLAQVHCLLEAIAACDWEDAEMVISAVLDEARAGGPKAAFGSIEDEAEFWSRLATFEELRAYFLACGKRLARGQIGRRGRIRLAQILLAQMSVEDRRAVISGRSPGGATGQVRQPDGGKASGHCR